MTAAALTLPLGGEQVHYYPTSELQEIVCIVAYKGICWSTVRERLELTAGTGGRCLCDAGDAADRRVLGRWEI